ncbi:competence/damage-inducible protein A [Hyphobacterium marinum]|uniref:Molybdopterin-binding protein n=1 Tax=Hyphobacterium marinum TaxID=3116574 RepID=A0ABU7LZ71_9PROT|nr:molybdopterin-binding protein [Hyphobacterium sp. Y6023]MEE2566858.1 molybdopterin-binding protein [Hyphobacterium sp. Y6023]
MAKPKRVTAGVLLIGDELLSGRTRDVNLQEIATFLAPLGIAVAEARIVSDEADRIVMALNALRTSCTYVFTTGGIGPTHDDITADAVAAAFGVSIDVRDDALAVIEDWYSRSKTPLTESRKRMARIPDGASLVTNPVTGAPGFQIGNVFVMAGVPKIMRGMLEDVAHRLEGGAVTHAITVSAGGLREGDLAEALRTLQAGTLEVSIGSYPFFIETRDGAPRRGTNLVARSTDQGALNSAGEALMQIVRDAGGEPVLEDGAKR